MNDLFFIDYEPKVMLVDTLHRSPDTDLAHRIFCDVIWATGRPLQNDDSILCQTAKAKPHAWARIKGELIAFLQWREDGGLFSHLGTLKTLERCQRKHKEAISRAKKGAEARWSVYKSQCSSNAQAMPGHVHSESQSQSQSQSPMVQTKREFPKLDEVIELAKMIGVSEQDAEDFWNHFESSGWIDKNGHPIVSWQSKLKSWQSRRISDSAERQHHGPVHSPASHTTHSKEYDRVIDRIKQIRANAPRDAMGAVFYTAKDKSELKLLATRKSELQNILQVKI